VFELQGSGFRVQGSGFRAEGVGSRVCLNGGVGLEARHLDRRALGSHRLLSAFGFRL
jgi:hypothetical protein